MSIFGTEEERNSDLQVLDAIASVSEIRQDTLQALLNTYLFLVGEVTRHHKSKLDGESESITFPQLLEIKEKLVDSNTSEIIFYAMVTALFYYDFLSQLTFEKNGKLSDKLNLNFTFEPDSDGKVRKDTAFKDMKQRLSLHAAAFMKKRKLPGFDRCDFIMLDNSLIVAELGQLGCDIAQYIIINQDISEALNKEGINKKLWLSVCSKSILKFR